MLSLTSVRRDWLERCCEPAQRGRADLLAQFAMAVSIGRVDERGMIRTLIYLAEACVLLTLVRRAGRRARPYPLRDKFGHCRFVLPNDGGTLLQLHNAWPRGI